jgi:hypothetical protein
MGVKWIRKNKGSGTTLRGALVLVVSTSEVGTRANIGTKAYAGTTLGTRAVVSGCTSSSIELNVVLLCLIPPLLPIPPTGDSTCAETGSLASLTGSRSHQK